MQEVTAEMRKKGIKNIKLIDREEWREKNNFLRTVRFENVDTL